MKNALLAVAAALVCGMTGSSSAPAAASLKTATEPALVAVATFPQLVSQGDSATGSLLARLVSTDVEITITICRDPLSPCETHEATLPAAALVKAPGPGDLTLSAESTPWGDLQVTFTHEGRTPLRDACADAASRAAYAVESTGNVSFGSVRGSIGPWQIQASGCADWADAALVQYRHG